MDIVLANSRNTARLAEAAGVKGQAIRVVNPGTDLPGRDSSAGRAFRDDHGLGQRPLIISVGRLTARKGLAEFVEHALPAILEQSPELILLVIGEDARHAINAERDSQTQRIVKAAATANVEAAIRFLPACDDATVSAALSAADVHIFPVLEFPGDVEGFGMVAIEAAAHGLPTVAFASGGTADAIVENATGRLITAGDYAAFADQVVHYIRQRDDLVARTACFKAASRYGWDRFSAEIEAALALPGS